MRFYKILIIILFLFVFCQTRAENNFFGRFELGTPISNSSFEGASFGINTGAVFKGIEAGLALNVYCQKWNQNKVDFFQVSQYDNSDILSKSINGNQSYYQYVNLSISLGYDLMCLLHKESSHHVKPFVTFGYSNITDNYSSELGMNGLNSFELGSKYESGFDISVGARYEYNITKNFAAGVFYKVYLLTCDKDFAGVSISYCIPFK